MTDNRGNQFQREPARTTMIERVDTSILGGMAAIDGSGNALRTNFLPTNFTEAMEMAKLMSAGTFVPTRLRNKPGDCLAVVMQATRWGMDPFAVAQKIYFVNNDGIPGYEAQLIAAVINTSGALEGTLSVRWEGEGDSLKAFASGKRKNWKEAREIEQELRTITTKNSPLWKQSPRQQLGYYVQRLWARLYAPEVMLGVYTADELTGADGEQARRIEGQERPTTPTRAAVASRVVEGDAVKPREEAHDPDTGEVVDEEEERRVAQDLDAETQRKIDGDDDHHEDEAAGDRGGDVQAGGGDVAPTTAEAGPGQEGGNAVTEAAPAAPTIDWESWLAKLGKDFDSLDNTEAVNKLYDSKGERLSAAPDGVKNRARGYRDARLRKLTPSMMHGEEAKPAAEPAKKRSGRTATAAAAIAETKAPEPGPEPVEPAQDDEVSPATKRADEIIADLGKKELLIDLRSAKAGYDADIDAMDEDNAGRVNRAYRAIEDRLAAAARRP